MDQEHLIATILFSLILGANAFSYKEAKNWGKKYPECNGKHQSPILIDQYGESLMAPYETLKLKDFNKLPEKLTMKNTGHTVEIKAAWSGKPPSVTGGPLNGSYVFEKTTFHWAQKKWTEEVIPGNAKKEDYMYDMDVRMFFYKTDLKSFEKAETQKGGLAVFKMPLKIGNHNPVRSFDNLERNLHKVHSPNSTAEIPPFRLASAFDVGAFLVYDGSLDYPPCWESVTWFIYTATSDVPKGLVNGLRKIKLAEGDVSNVRSLQPLNNREIRLVYNAHQPGFSTVPDE